MMLRRFTLLLLILSLSAAFAQAQENRPLIPETQDESNGPGLENLTWCGVSVIIDNTTSELFEMSKPDDDPAQKPAFLVTQSTANLVRQDFERYEPSLERMAEEWRENKKRLSSEKTGDKE